MPRSYENRLSNSLACWREGCEHCIALGERMTVDSDGIMNWSKHYPECPPPEADCGCGKCLRRRDAQAAAENGNGGGPL